MVTEILNFVFIKSNSGREVKWLGATQLYFSDGCWRMVGEMVLAGGW
jgi:hypothetical protein